MRAPSILPTLWSKRNSLTARAPWLAPFLHHVRELREQVVRIVRARRGFRVILHAEQGHLLVTHAFIGVIVQIHMRDFHVARRKRIGIYGKTMILRRDFHLLGQQIFHRMIRAVMAEFQLERFSAQSESAELVAKANPENRNLANELADGFNRVANRLRIAGAIGKKNAVAFQVENIFSGSLRGRDPNIAIVIHKQPENVLLYAVIESQDAVLVTFALRVRLAHLLGPARNRYFDRA